jgi:hypothetical protein
MKMQKQLEIAFREISLDAALAAAGPEIARILERSLAGNEIGFEDGLQLAEAEGANLAALVKTADELCRRAVGERITYVVNRNINFTNVCIVGCAFCRRPWRPASAAPQRFAFKAAFRATWTVISIEIFCAPSRPQYPKSTFTHSPRWKLTTAWKRPACRCSSIWPC